MKTEPWVEDENHQTINGERWVARECTTGCVGDSAPDCEWVGVCFHCMRPGKVRWYRADSPALAFFDEPKEDAAPEKGPAPRPLSEICMDGIRSSLKTLFQERDRQAVEDLRDSQAASLDARVQASLDAMLTVPDSFAEPEPALVPEPTPDNDVEIVIYPTQPPKQIQFPNKFCWCVCWNTEGDIDEGHAYSKDVVTLVFDEWKHHAILLRGHLTPTELVTRVRKMLAEKEGK